MEFVVFLRLSAEDKAEACWMLHGRIVWFWQGGFAVGHDHGSCQT